VHDPHHVALRRAARTALLAPPLFALGLFVLDNDTAALFAVFGVIAMFAFADFGGPLRRRAVGYAGLTAVGAALIPLGTLLSGRPFSGAAGMAAVAFVITFAAAAGGYVAAGGAAATLSFVLSVAVPAGADEIPSRLLGWGIAGVAVTVAAVTLWPARVRSRLRRLAAELAAAVADVLDAVGDRAVDVDLRRERRARARDASETLLVAYLHLPYRPAGPTARDQALVYLLSELRRGCEFADALDSDPRISARLRVDDRTLLGSAASTFRDAAATLGGAPPPNLGPLEDTRRGYLEKVEQTVPTLEPTAARELVHRALDIRIVSYIALSAAVNVALSVGRRVRDPGFALEPLAPEPGLEPAVGRLASLVRANLRLDSVWLQAAIRAAIGLGLAVLIALLARVDHAFWVILGTMSALKSSVVSTAHTAWQSFLGTAAGFALSSAFLFASGERHPVLWAALPVCLFLAVYTPTVVHAVVGQAMFTIAIVVLFNILQPEGWRTGLVRIEDILIGCGTSIVVGSLLWPRGAGAQLRARLEDFLGSGGRYVREAFGRALGRTGDADADAAGAATRESGLRAVDAFATFLNERGPDRLPIETWVRLLGAGYQLRFAGDAIVTWARGDRLLDVPREAANGLESAARRFEEELEQEGRRLTLVSPISEKGGRHTETPGSLVPGEAGRTPTYAVLVLEEWITHLGTILERIREPVAEVSALARRPWWR
jgi:uncharacterized membrane protein YccC